MSATGNEVVTLSQFKTAFDSLGGGGGIPLKTINRNMDPNDLNDISDVGIYYRDGGGTISNVPSGSTPFVLEVLPMWYTGSYWIMMQRQIVSGGSMYIRTIYGNNEWGKWQKYQHSEYSI